MDPAFIAVGMTFVGGIGLKALQNLVTKRQEAGSIVVFGYEDRWKNPKYILSIHKTRELERAAGLPETACYCSGHTATKGEGCGFNGCGHVDCQWECVPDKPYGLKPKPNPKGLIEAVNANELRKQRATPAMEKKISDTLQGKPMCLDCEWGEIEVDHLLDSAKVFRDNMCRNCRKEHLREVGQNMRDKVVDGKEIVAVPSSMDKPLTIFTASGPKQITEVEFRTIARKMRVCRHCNKTTPMGRPHGCGN